jgi:outer membrane protein assembly factor BamA
LRGDLQWSNLNFLGGARRLSAETKYSAIDKGVKFTMVEPYFLRRGFSLNVSGTLWSTDDLTYTSQTFGGRATVIFHSDGGLVGPREAIHREVRFAYLHEYLRSDLSSLLDDPTLRPALIALGVDPETGTAAGTQAGFDLDLERQAVDDALVPHRGTIASAHFMYVAPALGGTYDYREVMLEGRVFLPVGSTVVWANRARIGDLFAGLITDLPFSARYFLGGSTSVRGWGRYEISPLDSSGLPVGGRTLFEMSSELRFPVRGPLSAVAFVDAGVVGATTSTYDFGDLRYAVGPGLRYRTPIGPVRVDVGMQLNPIPGLVVNGTPETRHWRVHFSIGHAF